jgi:hypothetical protein
MEYIKNVVTPIRQVAPRRILRGFVEDYGHIDTDVILLAGEVHYERKPVSHPTPLQACIRISHLELTSCPRPSRQAFVLQPWRDGMSSPGSSCMTFALHNGCTTSPSYSPNVWGRLSVVACGSQVTCVVATVRLSTILTSLKVLH